MSLLPPTNEGQKVVQDEACIPDHCFHAFDALYCALNPNASPIPPKFPDDKYPLFVSWNIRPTKPGRPSRLRGCLGNFDALALHDGIAEYALYSAFRDSRFRKIDMSELPTLECGISFLTDFEDADSYLDWEVGTHGIQISFKHPSLLPTSSSTTPSPLSSSSYLPRFTSKQSFSATYLPEVMPEQGWDKLDAIDSAIQKAGWNGRITEDLRRSIKLRRYQSQKCVVDFDEYVEWREAHGGQVII